MSSLLGIASATGGITVCDMQGVECVPVMEIADPPHSGERVAGLRWLSAGIFVTCGGDGRVRMLHALQPEKEAQFSLPTELCHTEIVCLATGPERKDILTGHSDGSVLLWNTKQAKATTCIKTSDAAVTSVDVLGGPTLRDAVFAVGAEDGNCFLLRDFGNSCQTLQSLDSGTVAKFSASGNLGVIGRYGSGYFLDMDTLQQASHFQVTADVNDFTAFSAGHLFAAGHTPGVVSIVDARTGKMVGNFECSGNLSSLAISHDDRLLAVGAENCAEIFDLRNTKLPVATIDHPGRDLVVSFAKQPFTPKENFKRGPVLNEEAVKSVPQFRPPLRTKEVTISKSEPQARNHKHTQTDVIEVPEISQSPEQISDRLDDNHFDLVARLATLEVELSEMRRDMSRILALLESK